METSRVVIGLAVITYIVMTAIVLIMPTVRAPMAMLTIRTPMRALTRMITFAVCPRPTPPTFAGTVLALHLDFVPIRIAVDIPTGVKDPFQCRHIGHGRLRRSLASRTWRAVASNSRRRVSARFQAVNRRNARTIIDGRACRPLLKLMVHFRSRGQHTPAVSRWAVETHLDYAT